MKWVKETRGGATLWTRDWALVDDVARATGVPQRVVQGGWNRGGVAASAGVHDGGGAVDISTRDMTRSQALAVVDAYRRRNAAAWIRWPEFGWPTSAGGPHIHLVVIDSPDQSPAAAAQVAAYLSGRNGLANHAVDPHPRPPRHPYQPEEPDMTPDECRAVVRAELEAAIPRIVQQVWREKVDDPADQSTEPVFIRTLLIRIANRVGRH